MGIIFLYKVLVEQLCPTTHLFSQYDDDLSDGEDRYTRRQPFFIILLLKRADESLRVFFKFFVENPDIWC